MPTKTSISQLNSLHYNLNIDDEDMEKEMLKPFTYQTTIPGKSIRQNLLKVLGHWVTVPEDKVAKIDKIIFFFHNSSLLFDDIQDHSVLRRGVPTAHRVFGNPRTLIAVNWIHAIIMDSLAELDNRELTDAFVKTLVQALAGQGMELYWRDNYVCPTETDYLQMIYRKTCLVFLVALHAMNIFSTDKQVDAGKLLTALGMYFQINDDYQNLHNQFYFDSKGFCEDISEGKFSYPIVHAINNFPKEGEIILDILRKRTYDVELKKRCLSVLEKCGSFEHTRKKLQELKNVVHVEIAKLGNNPLMNEFIQMAMQLSL